MKNLKTLTIGIAAYNEEANIGQLLRSIIGQSRKGFLLKEVIVACDGSKDNTEKIVKSYSEKFGFIRLICDDRRAGKAERLNSFYRSNKSDIILILDADVILAHKSVIAEVVKNFDNPRVGLVGGCNLPLPPRNFFEKINLTWLNIWFDIRKNLNGGQSVHNNLGCVSALSRRLADKIIIPDNIIPDDDFTYFTALKSGFEFKFAEKAVVYYRTVNNLKDFFVQHSRLLESKKYVAEYFGSWVYGHYATPSGLKVRAIAKSFLSDPLFTLFAVIFQILLRNGIGIPKERYAGGHWRTAASSKSLI